MPGHVFLVHGDLTRLACDAWLVPSGREPRPGTTWEHSVAAAAPPGTPAHWSEVTSRVLPWEPFRPGWPRPWLVLTARRQGTEPAKFVEPARQFLETAFAALGTTPQHKRALHLLALPVVGAGAGGGARQAGEIVRVLLPVLYDFVASRSIDVALVMKDPAQYAAAQAVRSELKGEDAWPELNDGLRAKVDHLAYRANRQELVVFLGAGVSQAAGLPSWGGLLTELAGPDLAANPDFKSLSALDQARVVQQDRLRGEHLGKAVAAKVETEHYSVVHALLAALPVRETVTTNYDTLFEKASEVIGRPVQVLPYQQADGPVRWLLKLHGCVTQPDDIVLTREDYLRYDAGRAALAGLVQGLLITRHMLFVGFSLNDDNFHRIADAVRRAVRREPFGTSLSVAGNKLLQGIWAKDLDWVEFGELPGSARLLEVFLDRLAARTVAAAGHLFDAKYEGTLSDADRRLRDELKTLASLVSSVAAKDRRGAAWAEVERLLSHLGCGGKTTE